MHVHVCTLYLHQVNRVNPSGDVERGQGSKDRRLAGMAASLSSSVNSAGLVNFGRTPVQVSNIHDCIFVFLISSMYMYCECILIDCPVWSLW